MSNNAPVSYQHKFTPNPEELSEPKQAWKPRQTTNSTNPTEKKEDKILKPTSLLTIHKQIKRFIIDSSKRFNESPTKMRRTIIRDNLA
jgi:hypothetical protein